MVLFVHPDSENLLASFRFSLNQRVTVNPTPCRDVFQSAGVRAFYVKNVAIIKGCDLILCSDHW